MEKVVVKRTRLSDELPEITSPPIEKKSVPLPIASPRPYSIYAHHAVDGVVGGVLIDHKSVRLTCSVLVSAIKNVNKATVTFEIHPRDGGVYTHHLEIEADKLAVADVEIKVPACTVKILADENCQDIYVTITAYPGS